MKMTRPRRKDWGRDGRGWRRGSRRWRRRPWPAGSSADHLAADDEDDKSDAVGQGGGNHLQSVDFVQIFKAEEESRVMRRKPAPAPK